MNVLETVEPMSLMYCINGDIMFALPQEKSNNSKHRIDQKCKERVLLSNGKKSLLYINWLITPKCNYKCTYCYAKDIMQCNREPKLETVLLTAQTILQYNPVVVALSGGEPFLSPYLENIILYLEGKTRIIIDTNGSIINNSLLKTIKEKDVLLRVSLDDIDTTRNNITRRSLLGSTNQTIDFIIKCIQTGIDIVVQTVVTKHNYPHLQETKEYLRAKGVKYWRLLPVSSLDLETSLLRCTPGEIDGLRDKLCRCDDMEIMIDEEYKFETTIQKEYEKERAGIVLVSPDGSFLTVNNDGKKVYIDPLHPCAPSVEVLNKVIDWDAHCLRYIRAQEESK